MNREGPSNRVLKKKTFAFRILLTYVEYAGKTVFQNIASFVEVRSWKDWSRLPTGKIPDRNYILNSFRNAKVFFFQNSIRRSLTVHILPTISHYVRRIVNSRLFRSVFLDFLQKFFSTWNVLPEPNSSPLERSNHTKIIKIHRENPF